MNLLVTGGCGFIGSHFVRRMLARHPELEVVNLDALTYAGNPRNLEDVADDPRYRFVHGSIADHDAVAEAADGCDAIVNFAAETHVDRSIAEPDAFVATHALGTYVLLEAARANALRYVQVSTDEVYGSIEQGSFTEESPLRPSSPYSATKTGADLLVQSYFHTYELPAVICRGSNNYGPYQYPEKLIPLMILNALEGKPLPIYGDGGNVRDWLHVEDHCSGILQVLGKGTFGEKYNIGGGNERTNLEIVDRICDIVEVLKPARSNAALKGSSYRDLKTFVRDRPGHDRRYAIDARTIRRELGWAPRHAFEQGLAATAQWYFSHRHWCEQVQQGRYDRARLGLG